MLVSLFELQLSAHIHLNVHVHLKFAPVSTVDVTSVDTLKSVATYTHNMGCKVPRQVSTEVCTVHSTSD